MDYLRRWIQNLFIIVLVCVGTLIFMGIFYPGGSLVSILFGSIRWSIDWRTQTLAHHHSNDNCQHFASA